MTSFRSLGSQHLPSAVLLILGVSALSMLNILFFNTISGTLQVRYDDSLPVISATFGNFTGLTTALHKYEMHMGSNSIKGKPYLVICYGEINPALVPMFSEFNIVRLLQNDTPPSWDSVAFLHLFEHCSDHPYVKEALQRQHQSPFLVAPGMSTEEHGAWLHGVHWPNFSINSTKYLRLVKDRPVIVQVWGEVFWRGIYGSKSCNHVDIAVFRGVESYGMDCLTMHYLQGVATALDARELLEEKGPVTDVQHNKFCSMIIKYNSSKPTEMFQSTLYDIDAIVRHMFFLQLSEYKPCERIVDCPGTPYTSFECMKGYKFHITMENSLVDGYVSEKIFNGARAGGIPLYFGASDVDKYFNPKSFVHCNVSREVIEKMRSFYPRGQKPRPFLFKNLSRPTDEELIAWADSYLRDELDVCVKRVIELDNDDKMFKSMLNEQFIKRKDIMNGIYPMRGVVLAHSFLTNPPNLWVKTCRENVC